MASTPFPAERFILKTLCRQSFFRRRVTAVTWVNHYFDQVTSDVITNGMGHLSDHKSMDVLATVAFSCGSEEGPKLVWDYARDRTIKRYWALVVGSPREKQGVISSPTFQGIAIKEGSIKGKEVQEETAN